MLLSDLVRLVFFLDRCPLIFCRCIVLICRCLLVASAVPACSCKSGSPGLYTPNCTVPSLSRRCFLSVGGISGRFSLVGSARRRQAISFGSSTRTSKNMRRKYTTWLDGGSNLLSVRRCHLSVGRSIGGVPFPMYMLMLIRSCSNFTLLSSGVYDHSALLTSNALIATVVGLNSANIRILVAVLASSFEAVATAE